MKLQVALLVLCTLTCVCLGWHRTPTNGLRMPYRRKLMTWNTFVSKVAGRTWSEIYLLPIKSDFPEFVRFTMYPVQSGNDVHIPFDWRDGSGVCRTDADSEIPTNYTHSPNEKFAILKSGSQEDRYFSRDPDSYMFFVQCFDTSTIVRGVCTGPGLLSLDVANFPPNQLNWWKIIWDLKNVMGLTFLDLRWRFVAGADGCPDV